MKELKIGCAMTGSFCMFAKTFAVWEALRDAGAELYPLLSENAYGCDTRFFSAEAVRCRMRDICGREAWHTLQQVEPIGPQNLLDVLVIAPCTGNTIAKIANGIFDTPVTMAAKSMLRNARPVVIGISTNDGLGINAKNIGMLMNMKHVYLIPFGQDDPLGKPTSLVYRPETAQNAILLAISGKQVQPILQNR